MLQAANEREENTVEISKLRELLNDMSLTEKIGQMVQLRETFYQDDIEHVLTGPAKEMNISPEIIKNAGSILSVDGTEELIRIQKNYMKNQPHHIPLLFMMDVIHGLKTIFPIPLGQAATFEPKLVKRCAEAMAKEASVSGLHVTFAPMADLVRDARWGRVMESAGEDPYLSSRVVEAMVKGIQGDDMSQSYKMSACVKHFAGYGAVTAGREYNSVDIGERALKEYHFPAYKAGIDAGAGMVMTAFHTIDGIPATTNSWLLKDILRDQMKFDGVLISDFGAIQETVVHGYSEDMEDAAQKAISCDVDIDMMTNTYVGHLQKLIENKIIDESCIDECVWRILMLKNKLGLFENPYKDADPEKEKQYLLCSDHRKLARQAAIKSFVLLKNEKNILPLDLKKKIAFIGPYTNSRQMNSSWVLSDDCNTYVTIEDAVREIFDLSRTVFEKGCQLLKNEADLLRNTGIEDIPKELSEEAQKKMCEDAIWAAEESDIVVMSLGEHFMQSGEATSRGVIEIPEVQMELFRAVRKVNKNIVVVLFNGRPLDLREISESAQAILEVWRPGTEGGHAIVDVLTGKESPSGKLPMSFLYSVGQVPVYYNELPTGRPYKEGTLQRFQSKYIDIPNKPLYPFGYGLTYTDFEMSTVEMSGDTLHETGTLLARVMVKNTGKRMGTETIQLYIRDIAASVVRPVKELKGFQKVSLKPGEKKEVVFEIKEEMLQFIRADGTKGSEAGKFKLWIGNSSAGQEETGVDFFLNLSK